MSNTQEIVIPAKNWAVALTQALETAPEGATIVVFTVPLQEITQRAMRRMNRQDLRIVVRSLSTS